MFGGSNINQSKSKSLVLTPRIKNSDGFFPVQFPFTGGIFLQIQTFAEIERIRSQRLQQTQVLTGQTSASIDLFFCLLSSPLITQAGDD